MNDQRGNIVSSVLISVIILIIIIVYTEFSYQNIFHTIKIFPSKSPTSTLPSDTPSNSPFINGHGFTKKSAQPSSSQNTTDPYGVSLSSNQYRPDALTALDIAHQYNIIWVRLNLTWEVIEPTKGNFDWTKSDALVNTLKDNQQQGLAILAFSTSWDNTAPINISSEGDKEHYPPSNIQPWLQYVANTVNRYKSTIHYWEVWNEPDLKGFWQGSPSDYASLLDATYKTIKQSDPNATVILGGLSLGGSSGNLDSNFLDEILSDNQHPATRSFDIANFHQYGSLTDATNRFNYVRNELDKYGIGNKPIWVTEVGTTSHYDANAQTQYMQQILPSLLKMGVARVFWFELYDNNPFAPYFGPFMSNAEIIQQLKNMGLYDSYITFKTTGILDDTLKQAMQKYNINTNSVTSPTFYNTSFIEYGLIDESLRTKPSLEIYRGIIQSSQ